MSQFSPILSGNQGHAPLRLRLVLCAASALHDLQRWWRVHKAWGLRYLHCNSPDYEFDRKAVECVLTWGEARQDWFCLLSDCCLCVSSTTNRDSLLFIWTPAQTFDLSKWVANPSQSYCGGPCGQSSNAASFWTWRRTPNFTHQGLTTGLREGCNSTVHHSHFQRDMMDKQLQVMSNKDIKTELERIKDLNTLIPAAHLGSRP